MSSYLHTAPMISEGLQDVYRSRDLQTCRDFIKSLAAKLILYRRIGEYVVDDKRLKDAVLLGAVQFAADIHVSDSAEFVFKELIEETERVLKNEGITI